MIDLLSAATDGFLLVQMEPGTGPEPGAGGSLVGSAVGAFVTTLIVGGLLVTFAENYTIRMMDYLREEAVGSFLYGIVALLALAVVAVLLVITIVGILLALPLLLVAYVVWAIGASIAFLAVGDRIVGREDGWLKPLLVGAAINGGLTITGVGAIVTFVVGAAGFGAVLRDYL